MGTQKPSCGPKLPLPVCFLERIPKPGLGEADSYPCLAMREQAERRRPLQLGNDLLETRSIVATHALAGSVHAQSKVPVTALANAKEKVQKGRCKTEPETPYPCPMRPGQWEDTKGAELPSWSAEAQWLSAVLGSTPRSTPPGTSTPGSKQPGSATLTFSSQRCLRLCGQGRASWGQVAGDSLGDLALPSPHCHPEL